MKFNNSKLILPFFFIVVGLQISCNEPGKGAKEARSVNLSPESWKTDYDSYYDKHNIKPTNEAVAKGENGAIAVGYYGLASRAGLEALKQGGNAIDAAMTTALTQITLDGGYAISYFGVMNLVYYEAKTDKTYSMDANWNSIINDTDPSTIPGGIPDPFHPDGDTRMPSGRSALVGGFMKGVEEAHSRFGKLPFEQLFQPAIYIANNGFHIDEELALAIEMRKQELSRLSDTKSIFYKSTDSIYRKGDLFKQPALAKTLVSISRNGADYIYNGPWGERLVSAVQSDGGFMTMKDLQKYEVIWEKPLVKKFGDYEINTMPNNGGILTFEALNLAKASGLIREKHWTKSSESLRKALTITQATMNFDFMSTDQFSEIYPDIQRTDSSRVSQAYADSLWNRMKDGILPRNWKTQDYKSSDVVVVIDGEGNIAALGHSINTVLFGKTAITVGGITISDAGSLYRNDLAKMEPGAKLKSISKVGILTKEHKGVLGFSAKGGGMHHRSVQGLMNYIYYGMTIDQAVTSPDFFTAGRDRESRELYIRVPEGSYSKDILEGTGWYFQEIPPDKARANGEGVWIGVSYDPAKKEITAASHTRSNSASVAY